jgi:hypothetical protein
MAALFGDEPVGWRFPSHGCFAHQGRGTGENRAGDNHVLGRNHDLRVPGEGLAVKSCALTQPCGRYGGVEQ